MQPLCIIPARLNSKGVEQKNFRDLGGASPLDRAMAIALDLDLDVAVTSDVDVHRICDVGTCGRHRFLRRPADLAQDNTPMIAVVQHVLEQIPGPPDQKIVLLQPTQPLRRPEHITKALELLTPEWDSVVSVTTWPHEYSPELVCHIMDDRLYAVQVGEDGWSCYNLSQQPTRRQDAFTGWRRDGTVYAFWRKTVHPHAYVSLYGRKTRPLIIPAEETCPLDTESDWREAERRLRARDQ